MDTKKQKWLAGFQITYVGKSKPTALCMMKKDATSQDWIEAAFYCCQQTEYSRIELHPYEEMYA